MKKNFFKKLSFVLALAMLISAIAPAAGAFAAASPALNSTKQYLYLSEKSGKTEYDFNVKNKPAGAKFAYASSNTAVATVDKATGLTTGVSVGSAKITLTITKTTGKKSTLTASVIVRDNIETVTIKNAPTTDLAVNTTYDFNRSFVTETGSTTKTSSITRWTVDKTTASIVDTTGVFTATTAGTYKVTALAFQSKAKYEAWKVSQDSSLVLDTDEVTVTVAASIVSVKQVDQDTFQVTFDADMSGTDLSKTTATVYQVVGGKDVSSGAEKISSLSLDTTGKIATVNLYTTVTDEVVYKFVYGTLTGSFTTAERELTNITGVIFSDVSIDISTATSLLSEVSLVNSDGVVIYTGDESEVSSYLTFTYGGDTSKGTVVTPYAYIYTSGYAASVTATFNNYVYDTATSVYKAVSYSDTAVVTGVVGASVKSSSLQFEVVYNDGVVDNASTWVGTTTLAAKDQGYVIQARFYTNASPYSYVYTNTNAYLTYKSSDTSKLVIDGYYLYPIAAGTVTVVVYNTDGTAIGTFDIVIQSPRNIATVTASTNAVTLGNNVTYGEHKYVTVIAKDSIGDELDSSLTNVTGAFVNAANTPPVVTFTEGSGDYAGYIYLDINARGVAVGTYQYKLSVQHQANDWATKSVIVYITVLDGNTNDDVSYYKVDLSSTSVDLKANYDTDIDVTVNGYNTNGVVVSTLVPTTDYYVKIVKSGDSSVTTGAALNTTIPVVTPVSGGAVTVSRSSGNSYSVTAYVTSGSTATGRAADAYIGSSSFTVTNSSTAVASVEDSTVATGSTILSSVREVFGFTLNGTYKTYDEETAYISSVTYSNNGALVTVSGSALTTSTFTTGNVYIYSINYRVTDSTTNSYIDYTFYPGYSITVK